VSKQILKSLVNGFALLLMSPLALLAGFGRIGVTFRFGAQWVAMVPGLPGDYLRIAYYFMTLRQCSLYSRISFGSFFAQSSSTVGKSVYIGAYCILGGCDIGDRTQIASHVQILSGARQHGRDSDGRILGSDETRFQPVSIGEDCWLGAAAIVMADVGAGTTIGAGSVVTKPVAAGVVAVGNPARVIREAAHT